MLVKVGETFPLITILNNKRSDQRLIFDDRDKNTKIQGKVKQLFDELCKIGIEGLVF